MEIEAVASWGRLDWCGHNGMAAELPIEMKERRSVWWIWPDLQPSKFGKLLLAGDALKVGTCTFC